MVGTVLKFYSMPRYFYKDGAKGSPAFINIDTYSIRWLIALGANWNRAQFKTDSGLDEEQWCSFSLNEMEKVISNSFSLRFLEKNFRQLKIAWISNHMCESEEKKRRNGLSFSYF